MYFFGAYTRILQMSSKNLEWETNIHRVEKYEVGGNWKGGGLLWANSKADSWFTSTSHR